MRLLEWLFGESKARKKAMSLYERTVRATRRPYFFEQLGVPDTVDGRYDLLIVHAFLLLHRMKNLRNAAPSAEKVTQAYFEVMFDDMDVNLRELGVGDMGISRRIKKLMNAYNGRVQAYDEGLAADDPAVLQAALTRNLYRDVTANDAHVEAMAAYMRAQSAHLAGQGDESLLAGEVSFIRPAGDESEQADG